MRFVDDEQRVFRQIVEQRRRRLAGLSSRQIARIVFDAAAVAEFADHLEIETRALFEPLRLDEFVVLVQVRKPVAEFVLDVVEHRDDPLARRHVVRLRENRVARHTIDHFAGQRIEHRQVVDDVVEQLHPHRFFFGFRRKDVDHVAAHAITAALERHVVARVLQFREPHEDVALIDAVAAVEVQHHLQIRTGIAETVDRRHRRNDDRVAPLDDRFRRRQPHLLDVRVDRRILLYIGIGGRDVRFRLVVVVVRNEVLDRVVREEVFELAVELRGQGLVRGEHERGTVDGFDDFGRGKCLAASRHAQQRLRRETRLESIDHLRDRLGLIACGLEPRNHFKLIDCSGHDGTVVGWRGLYPRLHGGPHCRTQHS